jgi:hypothetical protein
MRRAVDEFPIQPVFHPSGQFIVVVHGTFPLFQQGIVHFTFGRCYQHVFPLNDPNYGSFWIIRWQLDGESLIYHRLVGSKVENANGFVALGEVVDQRPTCGEVCARP